MFTTLCLVLGTLISTFDPAGVDWISLGERIHVGDNERAMASVQLDLLPDADAAARLAAQVQTQLPDGPEVFVEVVPGDAELPPAYRVGLGPFLSFEDAERARTTVEGAGLHGFVRATDDALGC